MADFLSRTELLLGRRAMEALAAARVAVFGVGGVGGYAVEALARSGVGALDLIDHDKISLSNINRQIHATHNTVGQWKVDVAAARIAEIHPAATVRTYRTFYLPETADQFAFDQYDYVVDAIDTVAGKVALAEQAYAAGTPIISCMGAGNKLDPTAFQVADIYQTSVCPLAKVMRQMLRKRGIPALKVVYSQEPPITPLWPEATGAPAPGAAVHTANALHAAHVDAAHTASTADTPPADTSTAARAADALHAVHADAAHTAAGDAIGGRTDDGPDIPHTKKRLPGSVAFVPAVAGLILAGEVIKDLIAADEASAD